MQPNNLVKLCPDCSFPNTANSRRCAQCNKSLAGLESKPAYPIQSASSSHKPTRPSNPMPYPRPVRPIVSGANTQAKQRSRKFVLVTLLSALLLVILLALGVIKVKTTPPTTATTTHPAFVLNLPVGLGEAKNANGQNIGVNDGSFAPFDTGRSTDALKLQASTQLKAGNSPSAVALWHQALTKESNDAEVLIYIENESVLTAKVPYITLVAGVAFNPLPQDRSTEAELQGIYVAQHEFNANHLNLKVRIFIASAGNTVTDTPKLVQQIVQIARHDSTVVGVIGWRFSAYALQAIPGLDKAKIPLISSQAATDKLTGISPYFFRIVVPNASESQIAVQFVKETLGFKHPVIFFDPKEAFSQNLSQDFINRFKDIPTETFHTDDKDAKNQFAKLIKNAEQYHPDGFVFMSRSDADAGFFQDDLPTSGPFANIKVFAGDGSYVAHNNSYTRWYFIAVAYHGANNTPIAKQFAQEYIDAFNGAQKPGGYYDYTLASEHTIVAYDATAVTLEAAKRLYASGNTKPTPEDLATELSNITSKDAFQGVSGQIAFDSYGNPINKALLVLFVANKGQIQLYKVEGCFVTPCR